MFDEDQHGFNFFWGQTVADALDNVDDVIELHLGDEDIGNQHHHGMDGKMHVVPCVEIGDTVIQIVDEGAVCFRKLPPRRVVKNRESTSSAVEACSIRSSIFRGMVPPDGRSWERMVSGSAPK